VGRYLELDPLALQGQMNGFATPDWYAYALANPLKYTDPEGLQRCEIPEDDCDKPLPDWLPAAEVLGDDLGDDGREPGRLPVGLAKLLEPLRQEFVGLPGVGSEVAARPAEVMARLDEEAEEEGDG
jgi:hypothetical protein